jgi:NAD(P)-dependent dehydrogenase (short-subunit alcohol dehydrogenase family)
VRLPNRVAIVTGAGSGIGRATALALAAEGAATVVLDLDAAAADDTVRSIGRAGGRARAVHGDVTRADVVSATVAAALDTFGRVDVLVNNVGGGGGQNDILGLTLEDWNRCFEVSLTSVFTMSRAVLPSMLAQGWGSIVNVGSTRGVSARRSAAGYASAKAAVIHLTRCIAMDYADRNVRCNCVCPGAIATERTLRLALALDDAELFEALLDEATPAQATRYLRLRDDPAARAALVEGTAPMRRRGEAWDVAMAVLYLACDEARYVTGTVLMVDGGRSA